MPASGSSTKTMSPSWSAAYCGDPDGRLVAVDADPLVVLGVAQVGRAPHGWLIVRLRGQLAAVERQGDDLGRDPRVADLDVDHGTRLGVAGRDVGHRDRHAERRRLASRW